ncbi:hypothetical protein BKA67DRAFT_532047 [Truncatella angustata]|uniref:Peptidase S54 rhomboid domain-containing protein n=1 Tax=Truncatella angustata TaxID=152316 RepID=A0A9P9A194_9PEZI|nr:uncharacterized protein BKA67DRAFT_532047 [Truncatella angustata]KAH6656795.1 hypothetical protein BKA67DRAFT_532047 [Truncatella angustata]KAH8197883.1 hypothetical protein TruAng_007935 [Truncatella angustata]
MSFTNAPVSRVMVYGLIGISVAVSLLDLKHYFYILVDLHLWRFHQTWRALIYQLCYTNSSEVLFGAMTLYSLRVVEHMWGSRKYASFLIVTSLFTSILPTGILAFILRPLTWGLFNYLPAGPTPIIFAILAQYHATVPHMYKYRIATSASPTDQFQGVTLSDKSYKYLLAVQLAFFQWPGSLLGALIGWVVGYAWRLEMLPRSLTRWRIPGWMVGIRTQKRSEEFEGLRRRLEGEGTAASATGIENNDGGEVGRRRNIGQQIVDQFRGAI